jgi:hypothetical protein
MLLASGLQPELHSGAGLRCNWHCDAIDAQCGSCLQVVGCWQELLTAHL